jgi:pimeloyl-ACP methyl ester carboxylesterase
MKFIESINAAGESVKISYEDYSAGDPVILIHGWPLSKEMWGIPVRTFDRCRFSRNYL